MVEREITRRMRVATVTEQSSRRPYVTVQASGQGTAIEVTDVKAEVAPSVGDTVEVVFRWSTEATPTERAHQRARHQDGMLGGTR